MTTHWRKLGLVYSLREHGRPWMKSRAMSPQPLLFSDRIRVYFSAIEETGTSRISYADLDRTDPTVVLDVADEPLLECGSPGLFDDSGTIVNSVFHHDDKVLLYYTGYNRRVLVPWSNAVGLAISEDGGRSFRKAFRSPVLDRSTDEPYFAVSATVIKDGGRFRVWYASGTNWLNTGGKALEPVYVIKHGESENGIHWRRDSSVCIPPVDAEESTVSASVIHTDGLYRMWYCFRGSRDFRNGSDAYRIGYAESDDGVAWRRDDMRAGIEPGPPGSWDALMQAYPSVMEVDDRLMMFYNGNGFGAEGFGCAVSDA